MDNLTNENYLLVAAKQYWSIHYTDLEFYSDLKRVFSIKKLINKYINSEVLSDRLILNHIILLFNAFESNIFVVKMLFLKLDIQHYSAIKTFLVYLDNMPDIIKINDVKIIISSDILIDMTIANRLRVL
jgi:hypothetical protein